jgi:hypothetical protein
MHRFIQRRNPQVSLPPTATDHLKGSKSPLNHSITNAKQHKHAEERVVFSVAANLKSKGSDYKVSVDVVEVYAPAVKQIRTPKKQAPHRYVLYDNKTNNLVAIYGNGHTPADCVSRATTVGSMMDPTNIHSNSIIIMHPRAVIGGRGMIRVGGYDGVLHMRPGSRIVIGHNARLIVSGMLIMEKDTMLTVRPGATLTIGGDLRITGGGFVNFRSDAYVGCSWTISKPTQFDNTFYWHKLGQPGSINWCEDDTIFLVELIMFFCRTKRIEECLILPYILPLICHRYGVLMESEPYKAHHNAFNEVRNCPFFGHGSKFHLTPDAHTT